MVCVRVIRFSVLSMSLRVRVISRWCCSGKLCVVRVMGDSIFVCGFC